MEKIINRLHPLSTNQIIDLANASAALRSDDGDIVLDAALTVLELRLPADAFIALCETFE
jgi:hypothetical protein